LIRTLPVTRKTEHSRTESRVHYPALDGLRAVAFLLVFFYHYCWLPWGWCGVSFFFVLSGFLITGILLDTRDAPYRVRNFYVRRTLRIFPLYWGVFAFALLSTPFIHWNWSSAFLGWPLYIGNYLRYVSALAARPGAPLYPAASGQLFSACFHGAELFFGHFWSLCVEEQFYLIWPWVVFFVRRSRVLVLSTILVVVLPILRAVLHSTLPTWMIQGDILYRATPFQLDALILGAILAILWRTAPRQTLLRVGQLALPFLAAAAIIFTAVGMIHASPHPLWGYVYPAWEYTWGLSFFNLLGAALILDTLRQHSLVSRCFSVRPAQWLGRISYGAYVFHFLSAGCFISLGKHLAMHRGIPAEQAELLGQHWAWVFALPATIVIAWLSFRYFESPFLSLKERLTVRPAQVEQYA
jgi:peptidoglycan/LPS O-acetylase OafA/YrhL